jgi:hypothetical protein
MEKIEEVLEVVHYNSTAHGQLGMLARTGPCQNPATSRWQGPSSEDTND